MLSLLLALVQQTFEPFPPTPFDRVIPVEIDATDAVLEGHGRGERLDQTVEFSGTLHLWPKSAGVLDLFLRVETPEGKLLGEDDNSGGGKTPYLELAVEPGRTLVVIIAVAEGEALGTFELCAIAAPETDETRLASEEAGLATAEVKRLREAGELDAGRMRAQELLDALHATPGGSSSELVTSRLWNLGYETYGLSLIRPTESAWRYALQHWLRTLPEEHLDLQGARANLAAVIFTLGDLAGALALQEQVMTIYTRTLPDEHTGLQKARTNLAVTIKTLGDLSGARALEEQVLAISARTLPDEHLDLQMARNNLAITLFSLGDLVGARALQEKALANYTRTLPDEHPTLQLSRGNLALTIRSLGDFAGARALQEQVLAICKRTLPEEHPHLQLARTNLAQTFKSLGDLSGARALEEQVLAVRTRTLPDEHPDMQGARTNLAWTIYALGDLAGARALLEKVLEIFTRTLPDTHPDLQAARTNLVQTMFSLGDLSGARALQEQVLEILERTLPDEHPNLQAARTSLALALGAEATGRAFSGGLERDKEREAGRETCTRLLRAAAAGHQAAFSIALASGSPREVQEAADASRKSLAKTLSFATGYGALGALRELEFVAFSLSETTRGAALRSAAWQRRAQGSEAADSLRARVRSATDELARLAQSGGERDAFQAARAEREAAQRELAALARDLTGGVDLERSVLAEVVANALGRDDAVVAYRSFTRHEVKFASAEAEDNPPREESTESLCAFVVRPAPEGGSPSLTTVNLGPLADIEREVTAWREACGAVQGRGLAAADADTADSSAARLGAHGLALRRRLLDPLEAALGKANRIVVVLDDVTNLVPLEALPREDGGLIGDHARIEVRNSLAELLDPRSGTERSGIALTLGDARFDMQPIEYGKQPAPAESEAQPQAAQMAGLLRGSVWDSGFTALAQTGPEARGVAELWNQLAEPDRGSIVLGGAAASRSSLTQLAPRARWLHLATHGWHAPESVKSFEDVAREARDGVGALRASSQDVVKGLSPMLLCGLALAGANLPEDAVGRAPGLFTAEEMSSLDLSNCELAVLSACDTNVGIRIAGQGVASFQRALQMAGARSVITSLWKVPDEATRELMLDFYRRIWVLKHPKWQALWEAKMALRNAKDERGEPRYATRDWAAWVLSGEPN